MDMRFHWLRDREVNQKQFRFYWRPGTLMRADYWTKHHVGHASHMVTALHDGGSEGTLMTSKTFRDIPEYKDIKIKAIMKVKTVTK